MFRPIILLFRDNPELIDFIVLIVVVGVFFAVAAYVGGYAATKGAIRARGTKRPKDDSPK